MAFATPTPKINHIAYVLDSSGSMSWLRSKVLDLVNSLIDTARAESNRYGMETRVSLFTFDNTVRSVFLGVNINVIRRITDADYRGGGSTALRDGVAVAINSLSTLFGADPNASFLIVTLTDGEENASRAYSETDVSRLIKKVTDTDRWTITFQVPPRGRRAAESAFGVGENGFGDNLREWEQSVQGIQQAQYSANVGTQSYFGARSVGLTKVDTFYQTTDASKLTTKKVAQKLDDLSGQVRQFDVKEEEVIEAFVVRKTRKPYAIGSAYYQLMKPETVQGTKRVMIVEKGKQAVWGGDQARELIGLTPGSTAKVTPGNHGNYDIYVQSTSVNRKLPRGTKVLVDTKHVTHIPSTWDHTAPPKNAAAKTR